jgi:hypothetical protein
MTYNFDPDRWYEDQRLWLDARRRAGELSDEEYQAALADLDRRYEAMLGRLDGTFELRHTPRGGDA